MTEGSARTLSPSGPSAPCNDKVTAKDYREALGGFLWREVGGGKRYFRRLRLLIGIWHQGTLGVLPNSAKKLYEFYRVE
jgi:hypothetical protein